MLIIDSYRILTVTNNVTQNWGVCHVIFAGLDNDIACGPKGENIDPNDKGTFEVKKTCELESFVSQSGESFFTRAKCLNKNTQRDEKCVVPPTYKLSQNNNYELQILGAPQSRCHLIVKDN